MHKLDWIVDTDSGAHQYWTAELIKDILYLMVYQDAEEEATWFYFELCAVTTVPEDYPAFDKPYKTAELAKAAAEKWVYREFGKVVKKLATREPPAVKKAPITCPKCGGDLDGGHERDGSQLCWGHADEEVK